MSGGAPRVLITRPRHAARDFTVKVQALGFEPVVSALLDLAPTGSPLPPGPFSAMLITSQATLRFMTLTALPYDMPVFAVGERTAAACRDAGFAEVIFGGEDTEILARTLERAAPRLRLAPVLYPSGSEVSHDLVALLAPLGIEVVRTVVYASQELPLTDEATRLLCGGAIAWITLFSRHTAAVLAREIDRLGAPDWTAGVALACLAPNIVREVERFRWRSIETAVQPTEAALLACLAKGLADG